VQPKKACLDALFGLRLKSLLRVRQRTEQAMPDAVGIGQLA